MSHCHQTTAAKLHFLRTANEAKLQQSFSVFAQMGHASLWMLQDHQQACGSPTHHSKFGSFLLVIKRRRQELQLQLFIFSFTLAQCGLQEVVIYSI